MNKGMRWHVKKLHARQPLKSQLDKEEPEGKEKSKVDWRFERGQRIVGAGLLEGTGYNRRG